MKAHFINLEILLESDLKAWIVVKDNPKEPILKINTYEFNLLKSGIYKSQDNKISFNGKDFYLPSNLMDRLKLNCRKKGLDISNLAISLQEFMNPSIIDESKFSFNLDIFNDIINTNDDIYIICSKNTQKNYSSIIKELEEKIKDKGLIIKSFYNISETFYNQDDDEISYTKNKLILQHLLGLKIDGNIITDVEITRYCDIFYYDDNKKSIETLKYINEFLENLSIKIDKSLREKIIDILKKETILTIKEYTHNKIMKFKTTEILIKASRIIKSFENFLNL